MKDHEIILKMIEEVNPDDTTKLDEIDARVWCYLNRHIFAGARHDRIFVLDENQCEMEKLNGVCTLKYARSRDALKEIRPDGYFSNASNEFNEQKLFHGICSSEDKFFTTEFDYCPLQTEELAELHAIIQAIAYERGQK